MTLWAGLPTAAEDMISMRVPVNLSHTLRLGDSDVLGCDFSMGQGVRALKAFAAGPHSSGSR